VSYLLWHDGAPSLASQRRLFSPDEVQALQDVHSLCTRLADEQAALARQAQAAEVQARSQGRAQGLAEGRAAGLAEAAQAIAAAIDAAARAADAARDAARAEIAMLALQIARKLIGQLPEAEQLARLAQEAARSTLPDGPLLLRVHPAQEDAVRALVGATATVQGDAALATGACRLSGANGEIDASLDVQLARVAKGWGLAWPLEGE
jgi:flagellar assembly protein FliH